MCSFCYYTVKLWVTMITNVCLFKRSNKLKEMLVSVFISLSTSTLTDNNCGLWLILSSTFYIVARRIVFLGFALNHNLYSRGNCFCVYVKENTDYFNTQDETTYKAVVELNKCCRGCYPKTNVFLRKIHCSLYGKLLHQEGLYKFIL